VGEINDGRVPLPARDLRHLLALYDGISYTDAQIARIVAELKSLGLYDRTMIVVTSDHGESFREHGKIMQHGRSAYEPELRVPLIVRVPGRKAGVRVSAVTPALDVAPTVLDALGVAPPPTFQGRSALPLLDGGSPGPEDERRAFSLASDLPVIRAALAVREGAGSSSAPPAAGPRALRSRGRPRREEPGPRAGLASRLNLPTPGPSELSAAASLPPPAPDQPLSPELEAALRAAGYIK
jgi:arylsulfatase A-like enzyme